MQADVLISVGRGQCLLQPEAEKRWQAKNSVVGGAELLTSGNAGEVNLSSTVANGVTQQNPSTTHACCPGR